MGLRTSSSVPGGISGLPAIPSATAVTQIFSRDITFTAGAIAALVSTVVTQTVTGLLTTDQVLVQCRGTMTSGAVIANARVSATNTLEITFSTAVALGVSLGSLTYRITVFR